VAIGNKYQREDDLQVSPLLGFSRYYNSLATALANLLGPQWTHSYTRSVEYLYPGTANATAIVSRPEGNRVTFREVGGQWQPDADVVAKLVRVDGTGGELLGWTYTLNDGRELEQYDALGRLLQIAKADGTAINLTYNNGVIENNANDYLLTRVQDQSGRSLTFVYDTSLRISTITDAAGAVYNYGYDATGNLATVTYPGVVSRTYLYNEPAYTSGTNLPHALTGIVHEDNQRFATFTYAADGRAISTEHAGEVEKFVVQYNTDGSSAVTTPMGVIQQRTFDTVFGVKKPTSVVETCADCGP
jgi:YD repeat-containing protein